MFIKRIYCILTLVVSVALALSANLVQAAPSQTVPASPLNAATSTVLLSDGFDTSTAPAFSTSWGTTVVIPGNTWTTKTSLTSGQPKISPHNGSNLAEFNCYSGRGKTRLYRTGGWISAPMAVERSPSGCRMT